MRHFTIKTTLFLLVFSSLQSCNKEDKLVPTLTTAEVTDITSKAAMSGGTITIEGSSTIISRGVCWGTGNSPTISDSKTSDGAGAGTFTSSITGLTDGTTYFVRAYATNATGAGYGMAMSFKTPAAQTPIITTSNVSNITSTTATCGGIITSDGGAVAITARGVCWSTSSHPTITSNKTSDGVGIGAFTSSIKELTTNTTYHVRAYATNSAGTAYGDDISFITTSIPILTTETVSAITSTTAKSGGTIISDGRSPITSSGVCWSTSENPTIALSTKTTDALGASDFSSSMTGLTLGTTYYVRAYATNIVGTAYGNQLSFKTVLTIGQPYLGGLIVYIFKPGDPGYIAGETHGLIVTSNDIANEIKWNNGSNITTGAIASSISTGNTNTITIVNIQGEGNYAAKLCYDLELGGYSDWYLPSKDEIILLYNALSVISISGMYWSSTEVDISNAYTQNSMGYLQISNKQNLSNVRAFRSF